MQISTWSVLIDSLFDRGADGNRIIPGACLEEWLTFVQADYDDVDRLYLEHETIGAA